MNEPVLRIKNLKKTFKSKGKDIKALKQVSFNLNQSEILGLVGRNGAGKTTILRILCGLTYPSNGEVFLTGMEWTKFLAGQKMGVLLEGSRSLYWGLTGRENLLYFSRLMSLDYPKQRVNEVIEQFGLESYVDKLVRTYSRGMQQRIALAITLLHSPSILLLDEPTTGLDFDSVNELSELVTNIRDKFGVSVLLVSHEMEFLQKVCDRIAFLKDGIIDGVSYKDSWFHRDYIDMDQISFHFDQLYSIEKEGALENNVSTNVISGYLNNQSFLKSIVDACENGSGITKVERIIKKKERVTR